MTFDQSGYEARFEWGPRGLEWLAATSDVVIIVDVLSFSTAVDIAVSRGASILPYPWRDPSAGVYAASRGASLASRRSEPGAWSLSPASLETIPRGTALVLPSPNGASLSYHARAPAVITACLRNCQAVAAWTGARARRCSVIAAGEQWSDGTLRPSLEDLIGAGAVLRGLSAKLSPEAELAVAAFERVESSLFDALARCGSGRELIEGGFLRDVKLAADYGSSGAVPLLSDGRFADARAISGALSPES
jgi:2-phosphosulfolactate phosphatase